MPPKRQKLNQFLATAICGNDILSSALYVSGIAIIFAGVFAPLVLLAVAGLLYLYKAVYTEVVEALPVNGGAYNCLLNGTQKIIAALAGVITLLSYIATAVISAKVALEYLHTLLPINVTVGTIALLGVFALLMITGIRDSARVAGGIFIFHVLTLVSFLVVGYGFFLTHGAAWFHFNAVRTLPLLSGPGGALRAIFLAFSASLLGVSGFESSANFIEEQGAGVFRKTLRNMLVGVAIFNPLITFIVLAALPFDAIIAAKDFVLADAATVIGGRLFHIIIVIDACLVLSGAVLTSYVGVSGLISRLAADSCLPNFFAKRNRHGSYPIIVLSFFGLCGSILLLTRGNLLSLAGVYTIAFLAVMSLFALGNLILKATRRELKRTYRAPTAAVLLALIATVLGISGTIIIDPRNLLYFFFYFFPLALVVGFIVYQDYILRFALRVLPHAGRIHRYLTEHFQDVTEGKFVVFINHIDKLYPILKYIHRNETGRNIYLVHCAEKYRGHDQGCIEIKVAVEYLKKAGVLPHLHISFLCRHQPFGPDIIHEVAKELRIRANRVLIGSIHSFHPFEYADLHGARIIF